MEFAPQNSFCMKMTDIGIIPMKIFVFIKCGVETSLGVTKTRLKEDRAQTSSVSPQLHPVI